MIKHLIAFPVFLFRLVRHKFWVSQECRKMGIFLQSIPHDLGKWRPDRLLDYYVSYYCRRYKRDLLKHPRYLRWRMVKLRHQQLERHHSENWVYFVKGRPTAFEMPERYVKEMVCDWVAINRTWDITRDWYENNKDMVLHRETRRLVERLLEKGRDR